MTRVSNPFKMSAMMKMEVPSRAMMMRKGEREKR